MNTEHVDWLISSLEDAVSDVEGSLSEGYTSALIRLVERRKSLTDYINDLHRKVASWEKVFGHLGETPDECGNKLYGASADAEESIVKWKEMSDRWQSRSTHWQDQWSEVCNENQTLLNRNEYLNGQLQVYKEAYQDFIQKTEMGTRST